MDVIGIGALNLDFLYDIEDLGYLQSLDLDIEEGGEIIGDRALMEPLKEKLSRFGMLHKVTLGGSASNTCHALARLELRTGLMGVLGTDREGDFYLKQTLLEDTSLVARRGETGVAYIINTVKKDRAIIVFPNSNSALQTSDIDVNRLAAARLIHMTSLVSEEGFETQKAIKRELAGRVLFSIDPGEIYARKGTDLFPLIEDTEVFFTTAKEMDLLFGPDRDEALRMAKRMARIVVVKRGREGASVYGEGFSFDAEAQSVAAIDNTGAGDVLNGVFLGLYLRDIDAPTALKVAVKAASASVAGYGREAYPDRHTVEAMLGSLRNIGRR